MDENSLLLMHHPIYR